MEHSKECKELRIMYINAVDQYNEEDWKKTDKEWEEARKSCPKCRKEKGG